MALERKTETGRTAIRALTTQEIDRRIQGLVDELAVLRRGRAATDSKSKGVPGPHWIEPADLVRSLQRYIVYN
jgi:hypothetical protein